jgi:hypothetical protein
MSPSDPEKNAVRALNAGRLGLAEMWAWSAIRQSGESPTALSVLAAIAAHVGLPETGLRFLQRATAINPQLPNLAGNIRAIEDIVRERRMAPGNDDGASRDPGPRYLLIKAWGGDFWADACHVAVQSLLAELTGRIPVVHWGAGSRFNDDAPGDCFVRFFEPVSGIGVSDLAAMEAACYPAPWRAATLLTGDPPDAERARSQLPASHFLARTEPIAIADHYTSMAALRGWIPQPHRLMALSLYELWQRQLQTVLRPLSDHRQRARQFVALHFAGSPFFAVDCHGLDPAASDFDACLEWAGQRIAALSAEIAPLPVFLATDRQPVLQRFRQRFGDRLHVTDTRRSGNGATENSGSGAADPHRAGADALLGALIALEAVGFVGMGASHLSCAVAYWRPWVEGRCVLRGLPVFEDVDRAVYGSDFRAPAAAHRPEPAAAD